MADSKVTKRNIPASWVKDQTTFLKAQLPKKLQTTPFYPDASFYAQYDKDHLKGLHYMATVLFDWLDISPNGCTIDFYDEKELTKFSGDTAGFYTKLKNDKGDENEVILINSKYKTSPLAVGAILAHEMMHLYLFRLNLKLADIQENELLTDLGTIEAGLPILVLNGMSYSSDWHLTIIMAVFGRIYWRSKQLAFGYFKPQDYGAHASSYFKSHNLGTRDVVGYVNPSSRKFLTRIPFIKARESTAYIKLLEKQSRRTTLIRSSIVAPFIIFILYSWISGSISSNTQNTLSNEINDCRTTVAALENKITADQNSLDTMKTRMDDLKLAGAVDEYNLQVDPYNTLLGEVNQEVTNSEGELQNCNALIEQYNARSASQ